jgi:hypothetical protein
MKKKERVAFSTLFLISLVYDRGVIRRGDRQGWLEPFTALTVVAGVLYTLLGVWAVDRKAAVKVFWAFAFSGTPMIVGDLERYLERVRNGDSALAYLAARHGKGGEEGRGKLDG